MKKFTGLMTRKMTQCETFDAMVVDQCLASVWFRLFLLRACVCVCVRVCVFVELVACVVSSKKTRSLNKIFLHYKTNIVFYY